MSKESKRMIAGLCLDDEDIGVFRTSALPSNLNIPA